MRHYARQIGALLISLAASSAAFAQQSLTDRANEVAVKRIVDGIMQPCLAVFIAVNQAGANPAGKGVEIVRHLP
jgi:hypothetical protein